jgi:hypothetical protein
MSAAADSASVWEVPKRRKGKKISTSSLAPLLSSKSQHHQFIPDTEIINVEQVVTHITTTLLPALKTASFTEELLNNIDKTYDRLVIMGVGNLSSPASVLQIALALILKNHVLKDATDSGAVVYDPIMTIEDIQVCNMIGFSTSQENKRGKFEFKSGNTLYYMPHCPYRLYSNVLWSHWGSSLANITIIGNR